MASKQAIESGRAFVRLFLKNDMSRQLVLALRAAQAKLRQFGQSAMATGRQIMVAGGLMAAPFVFATRTFAQFDDQMFAVATKTNAAADEMAKLTKQAKLLGRTTSFTAIQVAEAMRVLGQAGFGAGEIAKSVPSVLNLARATGIELAEAADVAAITLRQFKLDASDMPRVVDVMTATVNNSTQGMGDLAEAMKFGGLIALEYGLSLEDTAKTLGILANAGLRGTMGGTALRKIMLELASPVVQRKLENMIGPITELGELKAPSEILQSLGRHMENVAMSGPQRLALFRDLFQIRAVGASAKLTSVDMTSLSNAIDNAAGSAAKAASKMDSGLGGAFRILLSAVEGLKIAVGESLGPALQKLAKIMTKSLLSAIKWIEANKGAVVAMAASLAGVIALGVVMFGVGVAATIASFAVGTFATLVGALATIATVAMLPLKLVGITLMIVSASLGIAMLAFATTAKVISGVFTVALVGLQTAMAAVTLGVNVMVAAVTVGINSITAAISFVTTAIALGPIGVITALGLVAIGIIVALGLAVAFWSTAKTAARATRVGFTLARRAVDSTRDAVVSATGAIVDIKNAVVSTGAEFRAWGQNVRQTVAQAFTGAFTRAFGVVKAGFFQLVEDIGASWKTLSVLLSTGSFTEAWKLGLATAKLEWVRFKHWLLGLWESVLPTVNKAIVSAADSIGGILTNLEIGWGDVWDTLLSGLRIFLTSLDKALDSIARHINTMNVFLGEESNTNLSAPLQNLVPAPRTAEQKEADDAVARTRGDSVSEAIKGALLTTEKTPVEMAAVIAARAAELTAAINAHKDALVVAGAKGQGGISSRAKGQGGIVPGAGGIVPGALAGASATPRGVALSATYSAAAARISGFQPSGPEQKMVDGIKEVAKNTKDMNNNIRQFLDGWKVK